MNAETIHETLSYDFVYNQARGGKPLQAFLYASDDAHSVLVRGCYYSNSVVYYRVMDPNVGFIVSQMHSNGSFTLSFNSRDYEQTKYIMFH